VNDDDERNQKLSKAVQYVHTVVAYSVHGRFRVLKLDKSRRNINNCSTGDQVLFTLRAIIDYA